MQWDDSYRYFPKHDENGRVQSSHHYFDTTDEVETLAAANRRLYGAPPTPSLFASMVPSLGSIIRCTGWVVLVVFIDFVLGVFLDGLSGRGGGDRRWGPLVRAIFKAITPEGRASRAQTGTPQTPRPKDVSTRYSSPVRPNRPHIDVPQREGSMVRSTADKPVNTPQQPLPHMGRAGASNTNTDGDAAPGLQWLLAASITLLRGLGWVMLWLLSVAISMIPRPKKRRGWSAVDQVQRRVDAALGLLTPPTQEELLRRELGRMLQQSLKDVEGAYSNNTPRGAHHRPEMMSRVVALSHNMLELQRMEACKDGKLLSPSSSQRVGVPAHMQFGGRSNNHHAAATSHSDSSLKEVYELWDRLLDKGQAMAAPHTAGTSCLPTAKDSTANNEALLRELLLQMGHRPHGASSSSAHGSSLWGRGGGKPPSVHYGKDSGSPPRLSRMLSDARGEHNKLSAMFALDGNIQSNNTNHPSGRGAVLGEVEAQLLSMVGGGRPQMPHRGTILGPLNPAPVMQQPNVNPFDCPPQQPMQQPMMHQPIMQQQGQWGAAPQQQAQQGPWGQQQQAPQQQQVQNGGFPQQQQQPLPFGQQQNNNQFQGNMQQQNGMLNGAAGGGMGGVFAGGGNNNFNQQQQQQNAFSTNTNNNVFSNNNTGACNAFAQGGNTNNGFPANNNNNNNFGNNFGNNNNQNNGNSNNALWGNNNNNNNGGSQQQNGGFGSNNQNNNNGFDQSAATSKVLFDDEPVMGRGTVNENNNNCPFSALSPETAASCNRFQRPPTTSPPVNSGFGGNTFAAGPRRAPAPCRSMDEVPVGEVTKARGGIAINVDMGPSVGPHSRPPLGSSRLATPAKPPGTLPSRLQANMERRQQELAEKKLERQSGTTRNSAFAHDRVSTPADACADWNQRSRGPGRPAGSAVNFDDMPVGGHR